MSDQPDPAASSQAVSPGARLRAARERMGLDIGAVAGSLHLDRHIVVALEEDRREALPAQAYVRGYVRAYARLVGVDADQLAAMADASAIDRPSRTAVLPPPPKPTFSDRAQRHLGWVFGGIVAAVLVATAAVLWTVAPSLDWSLPWQSSVEAEVEPAAATPNTQATDVSPTSAREPAPIASASPVVLDEETAASAGELSAPDQLSTPDAQLSTPDAQLSAASAGQLSAPIQDSLTFRFDEDSWVEVRDRDKQLIHGALGEVGDTVAVQGEGPFDILIGYAPGVRLTFNGDVVALAPHTRDTVARLVVGH